MTKAEIQKEIEKKFSAFLLPKSIVEKQNADLDQYMKDRKEGMMYTRIQTIANIIYVIIAFLIYLKL